MLSGGLVSFFEECCFSIICTRLRMDLRRSLCASKRVTDIASALADGSEHSLFGQTRIFGTLTQSTGRNRRGKHDFIGGRPPRPWTERISSSQSAYARGITQSRDLKSSLCGQKVVFDTIYMVCMVTTVDLERQLSLLDLGLTKAHRSCVDGDGAASVWTVPELKSELSQNLLEDLTVSADFAPTVDYQITDTQLSELQTMMAPYHLKSASPGKMTVLLTLGHQYILCTLVSPGDYSTRNVVEYDCPHCGESSAATRVWLAREANPLIVRLQLNLMVYECQNANVVKKLNFSTDLLLSPVKGASSSSVQIGSANTHGLGTSAKVH